MELRVMKWLVARGEAVQRRTSNDRRSKSTTIPLALGLAMLVAATTDMFLVMAGAMLMISQLDNRIDPSGCSWPWLQR